jgi:hypothetical protein
MGRERNGADEENVDFGERLIEQTKAKSTFSAVSDASTERKGDE